MTGRDSESPRKRGRKVRVEMRRNRAKTTRGKGDLTQKYRDEDVKTEDAQGSESVRAKGGLSRKRTIMLHEGEAAQTELRDGVVVALRGLIAEVDDGQQIWGCTVRRMLRTRTIQERHPIAVGDQVRFLPVEAGRGRENPEAQRDSHQGFSQQVSAARSLPEGVIEKVAPRKTTLMRQYERRVQVVAANVDLAVIVMAADQPTLRPHLIDRYLVSAHVGEMRPIICINKADLDVDGFAAEVAEGYAALGYKSLLTSVVEGRELEALREILQGQTSVLAGPSGVGKSSLLNALDPNLKLAVGTLTDLQRGRHTTTTARLLRWAFGGYVVDTPGLRQFDLAEMEPEAVEAYFIEFAELIPQCGFPSCSHTHEENCAVKAAVEAGGVSPERWESYCRLYEECVTKRKEKYHS
jgi:ribosome biogenesis GTPase / thiamine phosphate phosphatase